MKANLYINYYIDKNAQRQKEIDYCLIYNLKNVEIDHVYILLSKYHVDHLKSVLKSVSDDSNEWSKIHLINCEKRPTYNDYFSISRIYTKSDELSILANTDIMFPAESVKKIKQWHWNGLYCMALCRYDITNGQTLQNTFFNRPDAQDVWVVKGGFRHHPQANFTLGIAGCDNKIAHCLNDYFQVINPSLDIVTLHLHLTNVRNYISQHHQVERVAPPYLTIQPTKLP